MAEQTKERVFSSLSIMGIFVWLGLVGLAIGQALGQGECLPVHDGANVVGNLYIIQYRNTPGGGGMVARFNAANGVSINGFEWVQYVLNSSARPNAAGGRRLNVPWVDPPNGGYEGGPAEDNKPFYFTNSEVPQFRNLTSNTYQINDFPSGTAFTNFVTHIGKVAGTNFTPLLCFQWGYSVINGNSTLTPANIVPVPYDRNLTNPLENEFPGWHISFNSVIVPALGLTGILLLMVAVLGAALWFIRAKQQMP